VNIAEVAKMLEKSGFKMRQNTINILVVGGVLPQPQFFQNLDKRKRFFRREHIEKIISFFEKENSSKAEMLAKDFVKSLKEAQS
jgi:hypothetical protein